MHSLTRTARIAACSAVLMLAWAAQEAQAQLQPWDDVRYDVMIMDGLAGTAAGGIAGLTVGVMGDSKAEDVFASYILPGMGIGLIGGVLYGAFYDSPGYYRMMYMSNGQPKGLFHFDAEAAALDVHLARMLPQQEYGLEENSGPEWRCNLLTMSF